MTLFPNGGGTMICPRSSFPALVAGLSLVLLPAICSCAIAQAEAPKPLTNEDVVQLARLGLGDAVIVAKIEQSPAVEFRLEVADLERLKAEGVGTDVIAAMLKKSTPAPSTPAQPAAPPPAEPARAHPLEGSMVLVATDVGEAALELTPGSVSSTYAFVTVLVHSNFEGLKASVRTKDRQPSIRIHTAKTPQGRYFLVTAEVDEDDGVRSVKLGNMGMWSAKGVNVPDKDNVVPCDFKEEEPGVWSIRPKKGLKPGEYGVWRLGDPIEMAGFGID
jgi:hypothetical protein